ncbi:transmembrane protein, putative [Medicago truncatula]|uniref:Transmembrane protein, putative n=1 Tax=Medicago truncatula TaxID=3880 RepID=G7I7T1_MEDTR|nr:transmembrane protein, putative [Medicago truncatula]
MRDFKPGGGQFQRVEHLACDLSLAIKSRSFKKLLETKSHIMYPLVYQLLNLTMILLVGTTTVKRSFYAMKVVKTRLCNQMKMNE